MGTKLSRPDKTEKVNMNNKLFDLSIFKMNDRRIFSDLYLFCV